MSIISKVSKVYQVHIYRLFLHNLLFEALELKSLSVIKRSSKFTRLFYIERLR